jgi:glycosyltransferase involved in cell wall biosynthesis
MTRQILYVHHRAEVSGAARSLADLISHLDDAWAAHVLTPAGPVVPLFQEAGATVTTAPASLFQHTWDSPYAGRKWLLLARELTALPPHALELIRLLRERDFALVHLNDSPLAAAAAVVRHRRIPLVWHLRSALSARGRVVPGLVRGAVERLGDAAIAIDEDVARSFSLNIPVTVVFNAVTVRRAPARATARERLGIPEGRVAIGFMGNLRRVKGWPQFVQSAVELADLPVHFVVVGGGVRPPSFFRTPYGRAVDALGLAADDESELRSLVDNHGLRERFSFVPFTDDVAEAYAALDVVTFPNQGIGLGRPVLEAAAYGIPAVASGSRDGAGILIPERTGILLATPDPAAIAGALRRLVADPGLRSRLGSAAAAHARKHFDPVRNAAAVEAAYTRVLQMRSLA